MHWRRTWAIDRRPSSAVNFPIFQLRKMADMPTHLEFSFSLNHSERELHLITRRGDRHKMTSRPEPLTFLESFQFKIMCVCVFSLPTASLFIFYSGDNLDSRRRLINTKPQFFFFFGTADTRTEPLLSSSQRSFLFPFSFLVCLLFYICTICLLFTFFPSIL